MFIKHKIYGMIFNCFRIFPLKSNKISFLTNTNGLFESNFEFIAKELDNRKKDGKPVEYHYVYRDKISIKNMYNLATSKYVFLSDNFFPIAFMNFHNEAILVQLWHACGVFKKFGYEFVDGNYQKLLKKIGKRTNYLLVSSKNISEIYANAFAMDVDKTLPFGTPKLDYYSKKNISEENKLKIREIFEDKYPNIKNKKIVLYAPTFRETPKFNNIFNYFDFNRFINELGDEYSLFIRLHPRMSQFSKDDFESLLNSPNIIDVSDFKNEQNLLLVSDVLISDYSSMMAEFALLKRPMVFFAYDLDNYINNERDFYINFEEDVPGKVVFDMDSLIKVFKDKDFDLTKLNKFLDYQLEYLDDKSTKRLVDFLLEI